MANKAEYLRAFLQPVNDSPPLFGDSSRILMPTSQTKVDAAKFLYYLLLYSPNPCELEREYLAALCELPHPASQIINELSAPELPEVADWARRLSKCLPPLAGDATSVLPSLTNLAAHYFYHVAIALWNPSGKSTSDVSAHPAPDVDRVNAIRVLLQHAKGKKRNASLKLLVQMRDIPTCPITGLAFEQIEIKRWGIVAQPRGVGSELSHIMPFSLRSRTEAHTALEMFTGGIITAETIHQFFDTPENALLLEHDAHAEYDGLRWGIEAMCGPDGSVRYYSRPVREDRISPFIEKDMNKELFFGTNPFNKDPPVGLPDPRFCNIMLAVMRVLYMCGAADVLDKLREDDLRSREGGSGMGMSTAFDNLFILKLQDLY